MHFRVAFLVLGRRRRRDQRGIDDGPFAHHQTLRRQVPVDGLENLTDQLMRLEQSAEFQPRRRVRRRLPIEVDTDEATNGLAVVERVLDAFVRQAKALLGNVHVQHVRQSDRRTAGTFDFWIERCDQFMQLRPERDAVDLRGEAVAPC